MNVNGAWYTNELPNHIVIGREDGSLAKFQLTPFRPIAETDLSPYAGYHPVRRGGQPVPEYLYRFYGLVLVGDPPAVNEVITLAEAAEDYPLAYATLAQYAREGKLQARRSGSTWLTTRWDVERLLEPQETNDRVAQVNWLNSVAMDIVDPLDPREYRDLPRHGDDDDDDVGGIDDLAAVLVGEWEADVETTRALPSWYSEHDRQLLIERVEHHLLS